MAALLRFLNLDTALRADRAAADRRPRPSWLAHTLAVVIGVACAMGSVVTALSLKRESGAESYGGAGGVAASIACPAEHAVIGARLFEHEQLLAGVALLCSEDRDPTAPPFESQTLGVRSEQATLVSCPPRQAAVGLWGASGALVDQLSLSCAHRARPDGPVEHLRGVGGEGGRGFHVRCAGRLRGLDGAAGTRIDRVRAVCEDDDA